MTRLHANRSPDVHVDPAHAAKFGDWLDSALQRGYLGRILLHARDFLLRHPATLDFPPLDQPGRLVFRTNLPLRFHAGLAEELGDGHRRFALEAREVGQDSCIAELVPAGTEPLPAPVLAARLVEALHRRIARIGWEISTSHTRGPALLLDCACNPETLARCGEEIGRLFPKLTVSPHSGPHGQWSLLLHKPRLDRRLLKDVPWPIQRLGREIWTWAFGGGDGMALCSRPLPPGCLRGLSTLCRLDGWIEPGRTLSADPSPEPGDPRLRLGPGDPPPRFDPGLRPERARVPKALPHDIMRNIRVLGTRTYLLILLAITLAFSLWSTPRVQTWLQDRLGATPGGSPVSLLESGP